MCNRSGALLPTTHTRVATDDHKQAAQSDEGNFGKQACHGWNAPASFNAAQNGTCVLAPNCSHSSFANTSSTQLSAAATRGNPMVLTSSRTAWWISSGVAPAAVARWAWL